MGNKKKRRFTVQGENGKLRSVAAQSFRGAKRIFAQNYFTTDNPGDELQDAVGYHLVVWEQDNPKQKKRMRITDVDLMATMRVPKDI